MGSTVFITPRRCAMSEKRRHHSIQWHGKGTGTTGLLFAVLPIDDGIKQDTEARFYAPLLARRALAGGHAIKGVAYKTIHLQMVPRHHTRI